MSVQAAETTLRKAGLPGWLAWGLFSAVLTGAALPVPHEGHAPLPAKGVEVNLEKGTVLVTREARDALAIQTSEVVLQAGEERILAYARIVAPWQQHALVAAQLPGRIVKLHVQPGELVTAGQPLADLASPELDELQYGLLDAVRAVELSQKLVDHLQTLSTESVAGRQLQEASAKHRQNLQTREVARLKLVNLGLSRESLQQLERGGAAALVPALVLTSPIGGRVQHSDLSVGRVVQPTQHLFEVFDLSSVWCRIEILEQDLHRVAAGQQVEIGLTGLPGEKLRGTIGVVEQALDGQTHLGTAWVDLTNPPSGPPRLLPGMFGEAQVILPGNGPLMTVPASAVARNGAERFVLLQEESTEKASQYIRRNVVVVRDVGGRTQIQSPAVFPGDRIVTVGAHELFNFYVQGVLRVSPEASQNIGLRIEEAGLHTVDDGFPVDGSVELAPNGRDRVSAQVAGRIERILVERGQSIAAGQTVAELSSLELQDLQLQLITSQIELTSLEATLARLNEVPALQGVPQRQLWEAENLVSRERARHAQLRRKLETLGLTPAQIDSAIQSGEIVRSIPLRASIDGVLTGFDAALGQSIAAGETVFEIHDLKRVWIRGYVTEQELSQVMPEMQARIRFSAVPGYVGTAHLIRRGQALDAVNRTQSIWLELDQPPEFPLQHNMLARLRLLVQPSEPVLTVSHESIVREATRAYVFVKGADGRFERRSVQTGRMDDRRVEVVAGLTAGESVAAWGAAELQTAYAAIR